MENCDGGFWSNTIGGFADWFAVSALFHEIQFLCPQAYKHYSQKWEKLTEGIVDLVTNKWLSPNVIAEKLDEVDLAKIIVDFTSKTSTAWDSFDSEDSIKFANELDNPIFANTLQKILKEQVASIDLASL
jgi:uncharacterized membrane-anchored protein YjiN (DUF445 family)